MKYCGFQNVNVMDLDSG
ncbi:Protein of unknown function [Bacillus mycoides]|uniref:Uncharacterized protein n=1 Tax=Bacillus mycoides TaxID=1405 RepID=A0A1C4AT64_BACMY|nr:Protein of unknown function [Bacillus mycoides]SCM89653.1 Protein of unknown function [Bacillus mycoides]SCV25013.1 Protein of unknown function [Bacillus mycoides]